jgi:hypothetical protein
MTSVSVLHLSPLNRTLSPESVLSGTPEYSTAVMYGFSVASFAAHQTIGRHTDVLQRQRSAGTGNQIVYT